MNSSRDRQDVGGKSPLDGHRTDHLFYVKAVVREQNELRVNAHWPTNRSVGVHPKRAASLWMPDWLTFPWIGPCDISVTVAWDEEYGWSVDRIDEMNAGPYRGRGETRFGLGLGLVPEAAEAALYIGLACENESDFQSLHIARPLRQACIHDPRLEAELAAYLPSSHL